MENCFFPPLLLLYCSSNSVACSNTWRAYPKKRSPSLDTVMPLLVRSKMVMPISFSNSFMAFVKLG